MTGQVAMSSSTSDRKDALPAKGLIGWLRQHGGYWNPAVEIRRDPACGGISLFATSTIPAGSKIVECPSSLIVSRQVAIEALCTLEGFEQAKKQALEGLKERQVIAGYVAVHWTQSDLTSSAFKHKSYVDSLPTSEQLLVPAFWTQDELSMIARTNLYHAAFAQREEWQRELEELRNVLGLDSKVLSWDHYALASACISSRAFPSSLAEHGTLNDPTSSGPSYPLLLPGLDALNHRAQAKVAWSKDEATGGVGISVDEEISAGAQVYNNYGGKTTEAFILAYGFAPTPNASDAVTLKLGAGIASSLSPSALSALNAANLSIDASYEVDASGRIPLALWDTMRILVRQSETDTDEEVDTDAHGALADMAEAKLDSLGQLIEGLPEEEERGKKIRKEVLRMCRVYLSGQHDIWNRIYERQIQELEG